MSPSILSKIEQQIMEKKLLDIKSVAKFILLIKGFTKGEILNPGAVMRHMRLTTEKTYNILETLKEMGILQENYELYCHECDKYHHKLYEYYGDIPESVECEGCFEPIKRNKNIIVVYKVVEDGQ